jgi:hypothetical protein
MEMEMGMGMGKSHCQLSAVSGQLSEREGHHASQLKTEKQDPDDDHCIMHEITEITEHTQGSKIRVCVILIQ